MKIKSNSVSSSGKTYYYSVIIPAGIITIEKGIFCGTCNKDCAQISEISWVYNFGKKYFCIDKSGFKNGRYYLKLIGDYAKEQGIVINEE